MDLQNHNLNYEQIIAQVPKLLPPNPSFGQYIGAAILLLVILAIIGLIIWASIRNKKKQTSNAEASAPPMPHLAVPQVQVPTLTLQSETPAIVTKMRSLSFVKSIEEI
jgi:hypothetical protein